MSPDDLTWREDYSKYLRKSYANDTADEDGLRLTIGYRQCAQHHEYPLLTREAAHAAFSYNSFFNAESLLLCLILGMNYLYNQKQVSMDIHCTRNAIDHQSLYLLPIIDDIYRHTSIVDAIIHIKQDIDTRINLVRKSEFNSWYSLRDSIANFLELRDLSTYDYVHRVATPYGDLCEHVHIIYGITPSDVDYLNKYAEVFRLGSAVGIKIIVLGQDIMQNDHYSEFVRELAYTGRAIDNREVVLYTRQGEHCIWEVPKTVVSDIYFESLNFLE